MKAKRPNAMKTSEAMKHLGVETQAALAAQLGITRSAVSQWGEIVPELMQYRIEERLRNNAAQGAHP